MVRCSVMSEKVNCLEQPHSWLVLSILWGCLVIIGVTSLLGLTALEAKRKKRSRQREARQKLEQPNGTLRISSLIDIYATIPSEYRKKEELLKENHRKSNEKQTWPSEQANQSVERISGVTKHKDELNSESLKNDDEVFQSRERKISRLKSKTVPLTRSPSQNTADYLLRVMSRPDEYQKLELPCKRMEERSPTGRKISRPGQSLAMTEPMNPIIQWRRLSDRHRSRLDDNSIQS